MTLLSHFSLFIINYHPPPLLLLLLFFKAIIGAATFVCAYLQMALWSLAGQNQTVKIRRRYLQAVMRQEVAWFDENEIGSM